MIHLLGWVALAILASAAVPQAIKVFREGHARGMSWLYIAQLQVGFVLILVYSFLVPTDVVFQLNYATQIVLFTLMAFRKKFPRPQR